MVGVKGEISVVGRKGLEEGRRSEGRVGGVKGRGVVVYDWGIGSKYEGGGRGVVTYGNVTYGQYFLTT